MMLSVPLLILLLAPAFHGPADEAADLRLVPFPKEATLDGGTLELAGRSWVLRSGPEISAELSRALVDEVSAACGEQVAVARAEEPGLALHRSGAEPPPLPGPPRGQGPEAYSLTVSSAGCTALGAGPEGTLHALQTLRQLIRTSQAGTLPLVEIRDWPALTWRAFQDDLTRGPSSQRSYLLRQIELGAYLKLNLFTYYMEHQFRFESHPELGPVDGSLTPEDLAAMVDHGRDHGVDILGNQQSFGHMAHILRHPEHQHLAEVPTLLSPVHEGTYELLGDLYGDVLPLLPFGMFNVCCDETWGLGEGPSHSLAEEVGVGGVYVGHVRRLHELVTARHGKRMMMWGDIILNHPDRLAEVPDDVIMLTWGYHAGESFEDQIVPFARSGYDFFVCPGVSNWSRVLPDFATANVNIRNFIRDGIRHGALGTIITAWDDDGMTLDPTCWYGFAWGAECAWSGSTTPLEDFDRRIGAVLFGEPGDAFGRGIRALSSVPARFNGEFFTPPPSARQVLRAEDAALRSPPFAARRLVIEAAISDLRLCRREATANADLLDYFIHGASDLAWLAGRETNWWQAADHYRLTPPPAGMRLALDLTREVHDAYARSRAEFDGLWSRTNRSHAMDRSLRAYDGILDHYGAMLRDLALAVGAAEAGEPIPPAVECRLGLQVWPAMRAVVADVDAAPGLDAPWEMDDSSWRMRLCIAGLAGPGIVRPVEVDVPTGHIAPGEPVIALVETLDGLRSVPAQVGKASEPGEVRIFAALARDVKWEGESCHLWLYGGSASDALSGGVSVKVDGPGWVQLRNRSMSLAIGARGAHIFRWVPTAQPTRDLTLEGDSGFAGFADINTHRADLYDLIIAESGPAVARINCQAPDGMLKTFSLWAGATWVEVATDRNVGYFWSFDPPGAGGGGRYLFDTGLQGRIPAATGDEDSQVAADGAAWVVKQYADGLALGMALPGQRSRLVAGPGGGMGGVGMERGVGARHFIIYGGRSEGAATILDRLSRDLGMGRPPAARASPVQTRPSN